jgi:hypothetical protein
VTPPRLPYLAARLRARLLPGRLAGPGPLHPESLTADLAPADEDWLAGVDRDLWSRRARPGRLGADYTLRNPRADGAP